MNIGDTYYRGPVDILVLGLDENPDIIYLALRFWRGPRKYDINFLPAHKSLLENCVKTDLNYKEHISEEALKWGKKSWELNAKGTYFTIDIIKIVEMTLWMYAKVGDKNNSNQIIPSLYPVTEEQSKKMTEGKNVTSV